MGKDHRNKIWNRPKFVVTMQPSESLPSSLGRRLSVLKGFVMVHTFISKEKQNDRNEVRYGSS